MDAAETERGEGDDIVDESAAMAGRLRVALVDLNRGLRKDWPAQLTPSRLSALTTIATSGPLPVGELARRMSVSTPTVSHIVDALVKLQLITRRSDPRDRRVCRLAVSDAGDELLDELGRRSTGFLADRIRRLPTDQRVNLAAALPALETLAAAPDRPRSEGTASHTRHPWVPAPHDRSERPTKEDRDD
ncbi:MarR family winged helix-turn-helix transcriptional regulator [Actinoallomurus sp. CA-150999]|uniref:MarR family winged helix-turn-helix transcriptional regulator n=1 Tax=Actinoallomurus sp. CA-150999 TaxID=3239887 RepID=UPI003D915379